MYSFTKFLKEIYHTTIKGDSPVEIFKNPNSKEMKDSTSSKYNETRAIVHGEHIYTWDASAELHHRVRKKANIEGGADCLIDHNKKHIEVYGSDQDIEHYKKTSHFDKHFGSYSINTMNRYTD